ncbi:M48 family metallopeptidase [Halorussus pelagicus]|uniref:M48 family metallopeptidase n=1 Tax=Halorussus pelagicus TaxID=2505977 RepID=UPI00140BD180|nr:M48 family metalloprotease [Halorussus pelagicus]
MKNTEVPELSVRAVLAAAIGGTVLAGSVAVALVLTVTAGMILSAYVSDGLALAGISVPDTAWYVLWSACGVVALAWVGRTVARSIRDERVQLVESTIPVSEAPSDERSALAPTLERLAAQADVPAPEIRVRQTETPLAYTTSRPDDPLFRTGTVEKPVVVVSRGLVSMLSRSELSAVLAHELAHVANDDLRLTTLLLVPLFSAETLQQEEGTASNLFEVAGHLLGAGASIGVGVFSRAREFAADRGAVAITGDPASLASALRKIDESLASQPTVDRRERSQSTNAISVHSVLDSRHDCFGLRSTHPPVESRLRRLSERSEEF